MFFASEGAFFKVLHSKRHTNQKFSMKRIGIEKKMNE